MINLSDKAPILVLPKKLYCTSMVWEHIKKNEKDKEAAICRIAWMFLFDGAGIIDSKNNLFRITLGGNYFIFHYQILNDRYLISDEEEIYADK